MAEPILSLRGVSKSYGPLQVLRKVDLDVYAGEVVALLGENGAGKSTLSGIIAGSRTPFEGEMTWLGQPYAPASPREAIDKGLVLIHQELKLLPELSIAENVFVGRWPMKGGRVDRAAMVERAQEQLARLNLRLPATRKVQGLSTAQQQLVEIAKALALDAKLLILDEPTAALGGAETEALFEQVRKLRAEGVGHHLHLAPAGGDPPDHRSHRRAARRRAGGGVRRQRDAGAHGRRKHGGPKPGADVSADPATEVPRGAGGAGPHRGERGVPGRLLLGGGGRDPRDRRAGRRRADGARAGDRRRRPGERRDDLARRAGAEPDESRRRHRRGHRDGARGSQAPGPRRRASDRREHRLREPRQGRARRLDHEIRCDRLRRTGPSRSSA